MKFLLALVCGVHSLHLAKNNNMETYVEKLKQQQNTISGELSKLEELVRKTENNKENDNIDEKINALEKFITDGGSILNNIERQLRLPLD